MDYLNKPINLQNLSLALAKVKSDYDGKFSIVQDSISGIYDHMSHYSLSISGNTITLNKPNGSSISSITLPVYDGGVSS